MEVEKLGSPAHCKRTEKNEDQGKGWGSKGGGIQIGVKAGG